MSTVKEDLNIALKMLGGRGNPGDAAQAVVRAMDNLAPLVAENTALTAQVASLKAELAAVKEVVG